MNDRAVGLLEQYDIEVLRTRKGRGAILCDTPAGCLIFREYGGSEERLEIQNQLLQHIRQVGLIEAETLVPTREGALFVKDGDGVSYILKTYFESRECNIYDKGECLEAVRLLAKLHSSMELDEDTTWAQLQVSVDREYEKRNRELKRVRKYLQQKSQRTAFEFDLLGCFDLFLEQAMTVADEWKTYEKCLGDPGSASTEGSDRDSGEDASGEFADGVCGTLSGNRSANIRSYCHGDYQYHNILRKGDGWFIINFEKCIPDRPIRDLYLLMRKLLEKSGWSVSLGRELLNAYEEQKPMSALDRIDLYYRLYYPEKFWKIVNFYYNNGKAWIPERNREKLEKLKEQETAKQGFLEEVFRRV